MHRPARGDRIAAAGRHGAEVAGDDARARAMVELRQRDLARADVAVGGGLHLLGGGQVDPQLEAMELALALQRHLGMDDAAAGGHPLHVAVAQLAAVAEVVLVLHVAFEHVGHGLEAAVRMRREAGDVVVGIVRRELVEHQERVEAGRVALAEAAAQAHARAVAGLATRDHLQQLAYGHRHNVRVALPGIKSRAPGSGVARAGRRRSVGR